MDHVMQETAHDDLPTSTGWEKPETRAAPVSTECAHAGGALRPGAGPEDRPYPTVEANLSSMLEPWEARHSSELWQTAPDGTYAWRQQADGWFDPANGSQINVASESESEPSPFGDLN